MKAQSTIVTMKANTQRKAGDDRCFISGLDILCNDARHREEVRAILQSGPIQITRLTLLTPPEIEEEFNRQIESARKEYQREVLASNPLTMAHHQEEICRVGNRYAEALHAAHDWKHDQLEKFKDSFPTPLDIKG